MSALYTLPEEILLIVAKYHMAYYRIRRMMRKFMYESDKKKVDRILLLHAYRDARVSKNIRIFLQRAASKGIGDMGIGKSTTLTHLFSFLCTGLNADMAESDLFLLHGLDADMVESDL